MTVSGPELAVAVLAVASVVCDVRTHRVPNNVTFGAAALAMLFGVATGGVSSLTSSLLGWLVGLAVFLPFFVVGGLGAGDVKLLAAFGAWLGPLNALWTGLSAALLGGVMALVVAATRGYLRQALRNTALMVGVWRVNGPGPIGGLMLDDSSSPRIAYAIPIAAGALLTMWLRHF